jgi:hypothetical protein
MLSVSPSAGVKTKARDRQTIKIRDPPIPKMNPCRAINPTRLRVQKLHPINDKPTRRTPSPAVLLGFNFPNTQDDCGDHQVRRTWHRTRLTGKHPKPRKNAETDPIDATDSDVAQASFVSSA